MAASRTKCQKCWGFIGFLGLWGIPPTLNRPTIKVTILKKCLDTDLSKKCLIPGGGGGGSGKSTVSRMLNSNDSQVFLSRHEGFTL